MSKYGRRDAGRDTKSSGREVKRAWHQARNDAAGSGHLSERNRNKTSDSREGGILYGIFKALGLTK